VLYQHVIVLDLVDNTSNDAQWQSEWNLLRYVTSSDIWKLHGLMSRLPQTNLLRRVLDLHSSSFQLMIGMHFCGGN
jgi:hypothetical protein